MPKHRGKSSPPNRASYKAPSSGMPATQYRDTSRGPKTSGAQPQGALRSGPNDIGAHPAMPKMS